MALSAQDELRIGELVVRYAAAVTAGNAEQWGSTWAKDSTWHLRTKAVTGRDSIVALWRQLLPMYESILQLVTRGRLAEAGGVHGEWQVVEILRRAGSDHDCLQVITYSDRYVREAEQWLFAERRLNVRYRREMPAGEFLAQSPAR
ncbi:nuclear transport factor 2 family protein [Jatrophihabitans cynanchi]|uniref:Nuclear transport factor 2 family protein n=1 Tax=Jatrophihabitans cynanchi TaxID=2944128 RepID=A0ABY7K0T1_9ACTN|nr:nuclear transport factor 2 family protein [Jatrophihabitans sp. SB3-54]WAX58450.1 nuclear transport factor 2 family protein [Jatrophihabitans sp. SB3-54]